MTLFIILICVLAWVFVQGMGQELALAKSLCLHGLIPGELLGVVPAGTRIPISEHLACVLESRASPLSLISSMFLHGGWLHLIGNMWFLWVFANNVEDALGHGRYLFFYLLCGLAAALAQILADPTSPLPMVGASGAIGGVMGAYTRLFPSARISTLVFLGFFVTILEVPALLFLGYWFLIQLFSGALSLGTAGGGVAFWAHVGGFLVGWLMALPLCRRSYTPDIREPL